MAQENTAINELIHRAASPKAVRDSAEDLFAERCEVNLRGEISPMGRAGGKPLQQTRDAQARSAAYPAGLAVGSAPAPLPRAPYTALPSQAVASPRPLFHAHEAPRSARQLPSAEIVSPPVRVERMRMLPTKMLPAPDSTDTDLPTDVGVSESLEIDLGISARISAGTSEQRTAGGYISATGQHATLQRSTSTTEPRPRSAIPGGPTISAVATSHEADPSARRGANAVAGAASVAAARAAAERAIDSLTTRLSTINAVPSHNARAIAQRTLAERALAGRAFGAREPGNGTLDDATLEDDLLEDDLLEEESLEEECLEDGLDATPEDGAPWGVPRMDGELDYGALEVGTREYGPGEYGALVNDTFEHGALDGHGALEQRTLDLQLEDRTIERHFAGPVLAPAGERSALGRVYARHPEVQHVEECTLERHVEERTLERQPNEQRSAEASRLPLSTKNSPIGNEAAIRADRWADQRRLEQRAQQEHLQRHIRNVASSTPTSTPRPRNKAGVTPALARTQARSPMPATSPRASVESGQLLVVPLPITHRPEPTVRVTPLDAKLLAADGRRTFAHDFAATLKRFAAPLVGLAVVAILVGGYFAFTEKPSPRTARAGAAPATHQLELPAARPGDATTAAPPAAPASTSKNAGIQVTPIDEPEPTVSAVMASKLAAARAAETVELAKGAVLVDKAATDASDPAQPDAAAIEMEAADLGEPKRVQQRSPRANRSVAASKRSASARKRDKRAEPKARR